MGSDEELQEVADLELQQQQPGGADADDEPASPSACTPRELAAMAAAFLNASLDLFGAAEAAGGFQTGANRCGRGGGGEAGTVHRHLNCWHICPLIPLPLLLLLLPPPQDAPPKHAAQAGLGDARALLEERV